MGIWDIAIGFTIAQVFVWVIRIAALILIRGIRNNIIVEIEEGR